jgi:hypothetical protein
MCRTARREAGQIEGRNIMAKPTFEVDKDGLRKLLERRDKSFVVTELVQNSWDEDSTRVDVTLELLPDKVNRAKLVVEDDDPEGFTDITHAYTLFAESEKTHDAEKRGRFNLGEKFVIAACEWAEVSTTTGRIVFDDEGRHEHDPDRKAGSRFEGLIEMTPEEYGVVERIVMTLIPPTDTITTYNGKVVPARTPIKTFETPVWTEIASDDGRLKRTLRKTTVELYEPLPGETSMIYELGLPVVEFEHGDRWHVNVGQKVPLTIERDNVTPAWLKDIRRIVLNEAYDLLTAEDADATWILDGAGDEEVKPEALKKAIDLRFGPAVAFDPSDPEANRLAASEGYSTITSRALPREVWQQVKKNQILQPAGQVTPSIKPYLPGQAMTRKVRPVEEWTAGMQNAAEFVRWLAPKLIGAGLIDVQVIDDPEAMQFEVNYSPGMDGDSGRFEFNLRRLGHRWFEGDPVEGLDKVLYALAHNFTTDRLSAEFYRAVAILGKRAVSLALSDADTFNSFRKVAA